MRKKFETKNETRCIEINMRMIQIIVTAKNDDAVSVTFTVAYVCTYIKQDTLLLKLIQPTVDFWYPYHNIQFKKFEEALRKNCFTVLFSPDDETTFSIITMWIILTTGIYWQFNCRNTLNTQGFNMWRRP